MAHAKTRASAIVFACARRIASLALLPLLASLLCAAGCEKKEPPRPVKIEPTYAQDPSIQAAHAPSPSDAANAGNANAAPTSTGPTALDLALAGDAGSLTVTTKRTIATTTPVDPDQAILDAAHARAATCYDGKIVSNVPRTATVTVTVIPTGKVTRAEVRSTDTTEPEVLACLKALGEGLVFTERFEQPAQTRNAADTAGRNGGGKSPLPSSNGGGLRTYAINVAVVPAH